MEEQWIICPICKNKTRVKLRVDTILKNFPLFCPKCKQENLINAEKMQVSIMRTTKNESEREPDARRRANEL